MPRANAWPPKSSTEKNAEVEGASLDECHCGRRAFIEVPTDTADHVRARRKEHGLSPEELADQVQVHRTFIAHVERAESNISIDNIARISEALRLPTSDLLRPVE